MGVDYLFISVIKLLAALAILVTTAHSAMWEKTSSDLPFPAEDMGLDVARHPDGRTFMARFENVDAGTPNLYLAQKPGPNSPWTEEDIRNTGLFDVKSLDLSVDDEGGLHLAFITKGFILGTIVNLNYGYQAPGGDWTFEVLGEASPDLDEKSLYAISLDLDSEGLPGIAYTADNAELGFVRQSAAGSWQNTLVNITNHSGHSPSLHFFSSPDEPIGISHFVRNNGGLTFTSFQTATGSWVPDTLGATTGPTAPSSLAEVAGGLPAIAYRSTLPHDNIAYSVRKNGTWTHQVVDEPFPREQADAHFGNQLTLTVDAMRRPQITYFKGILLDGIERAEEIRHARQLPNGLWGNEVCVLFPETPIRAFYDFQLSAAADAFGNPLAVYLDSPEGSPYRLWSARPNGSAWTATNLTEGFPDTDLISAPSLAFGADGTRVVSAGIESGDNSYLTHWIKPVEAEQFTHTSFVESEFYSTETTLDDEGLIDCVISYPSDRFVNFSTPIQNGATLGSYETDVLDSGRHLSDLAIDSFGYRHLILEGDDGLAYFRAAPPLPFEAPAWENRTAQTPLNIGASPSIAISSTGNAAFAWTRTVEGQHAVHTTYRANNGQWESYQHNNSLNRPVTPSVVWFNDLPYTVFSTYFFSDNRTSITISNGVQEEFISFKVDGLITELETAAHGGTLHVAWRSLQIFQGAGEPIDSGSRYLGYLAIGACPSDPQVVGALPYLEPNDSFARIDNVDLAINPQGRPFIVANLRSDEGPDSLLLFEPTGDHGSSLDEEIEFPSGLRQQPVFTEEGNPVHEVSFLHPSGEAPTIPLGSGYLKLGAFTLHSHYSEDLQNETPAQEVIHLSTIAEPGAPSFERSTYQFSAADVADSPRLFYRLILERTCAMIQR